MNDHAQASKSVRLNFEKYATWLAIGVVALALLACFVAMYPAPWAATIAQRVVQLKDAIFDMLMNLATILGLSWGRGHMDKRVEGDGDK